MHENQIIGEEGSYFFTGRAATGIYLILAGNNVRSQRIILPASICYAAVYPIFYSENTPLFADVDLDGNLSLEGVRGLLEKHSDVGAIIIPHMYGNPCRDFSDICTLARKHSVITIEDLASAMGVFTPDEADYRVFSFGYSKIIDLGFGGLVTGKKNMQDLTALDHTLPLENDKIRADITSFGDFYRTEKDRNDRPVLQSWVCPRAAEFKDSFIHTLPAERKSILRNSMSGLGAQILKRLAQAEQYDREVKDSPFLERYPFHEGAVPWRWNLFIRPELRKALVHVLLAHHLPVSTWYPPISPLFGGNEIFPIASKMSKEILNFPLGDRMTDKEISMICSIINEFCTNQC